MSNLPPLFTMPESEGVGAAVSSKIDFKSFCDKPLLAEAHNASAPVTCGAAIEVPLACRYPPPGTVDKMS